MKEEDIEKAAVETAKKVCSDFYEAYAFASGFKVGANWHINSVWHKAEELPQLNACFLAQIGNDSFDTFIMAVEADRWKRWCKGLDIVRWAYIEDLLPNTEDWIYGSDDTAKQIH